MDIKADGLARLYALAIVERRNDRWVASEGDGRGNGREGK